METILLKGKPVRDVVFAELKIKVAQAPRKPGLAVILVGDDPASAVYVSHKEKGCEEVGFHHVTHLLPADTPEKEVLALVNRLNADPAIDGILVQLPLPKGMNQERVLGTVDPAKDVDGFHPVNRLNADPAIDGILVQLPLPKGMNQERVLGAVDPAKDVDGFHPENLGLLVAGHPRFVPCTPKGILRLLSYYDIPMAGKNVAVVGRSVIVGRPLSLLLSLKREDGNATVTMCHSGTRDLASITSAADVVIAAIGVPRALGTNEIGKGAVVVDVGINRIDAPERPKGTRLVGDVDAVALKGHAGALTPVPGGVGPMTIAMLLENTWEAMARKEGLDGNG